MMNILVTIHEGDSDYELYTTSVIKYQVLTDRLKDFLNEIKNICVDFKQATKNEEPCINEFQKCYCEIYDLFVYKTLSKLDDREQFIEDIDLLEQNFIYECKKQLINKEQFDEIYKHGNIEDLSENYNSSIIILNADNNEIIYMGSSI